MHEQVLGSSEVTGEEHAPSALLDLDRGCTEDVTRGPEAEAERPGFAPGVEGHGRDGRNCARGIGPQRVETHRHDLYALGMQLFAQCLPPGQVVGAASVGGPGHQRDLLASQRGEVEWLAIEIREGQLDVFGGWQRSLAQGCGSERGE